MRPKVVVFGIDGVRLDSLRKAVTPRLDAIAAAGFLTPLRIPDVNPTISGPCWATIATGVYSDVHGIKGNQLAGNHLDEHPCFLARAASHGFDTYAAAGWLPLLTQKQGGPIFRPHRQFTPPRPEKSKTGGDSVSDGLVADAAAHELRTSDVDLAFVYVGQADEVGHYQGTGDEYVASIENADRCVGQVCDAIASRETFSNEQWTYLAVTDHGHRDGGGHGGDSDLERTAWIAGCGPELSDENTDKLGHADIPSLALQPLGVA